MQWVLSKCGSLLGHDPSLAVAGDNASAGGAKILCHLLLEACTPRRALVLCCGP